MKWFWKFMLEAFFGEREKVAVLTYLTKLTYSKLEVTVERWNDSHDIEDHITIHDLLEMGGEYVGNRSLRVISEEPKNVTQVIIEPPRKEKKKNATPVFYVNDLPRGRSQSRDQYE